MQLNTNRLNVSPSTIVNSLYMNADHDYLYITIRAVGHYREEGMSIFLPFIVRTDAAIKELGIISAVKPRPFLKVRVKAYHAEY